MKRTPEHIRDISEAIYRRRLGTDDVKRMIERHGDGGEKLRRFAGQYDDIVEDVLRVLDAE